MYNKIKRKCELHTFAFETLYFDEFLFCDWRNGRRGKSGFWGDYFRTSIAFFRPLSTAVGSF